jgi:hypothetical protein
MRMRICISRVRDAAMMIRLETRGGFANLPGNNSKHVFYRSADNRLHELWWIPRATNPVDVDQQ